MPARSSASVKIISLDRRRARDQVRAAVRRLAARRPEVLRALLFGSLARGDAVPGSDADVLLVLKHSAKPFMKRFDDYRLPPVGIPVDLFAYTEAELHKMQSEGNQFIAHALAEGVEIYRRQGALPRD